MAIIGSKGIVDDGSANLSVGGAVDAASVSAPLIAMSAQTLAGSGSVSIANPGFYYVAATGSSGAGYFTGTVPSAATFPGARLMIKETYGPFDWMLTGSAIAANAAVFKLVPAITASSGLNAGTNLRVAGQGALMMASDSVYWHVYIASGSLTLTGLKV
jgi:hypothetical protein